jgi:beta-aspartyl-peptidase (threonine type)
MLFGKKDLNSAADEVILSDLENLGGTGGLIAVDAAGNIAMPFNTAGMYRGYTNGAVRKTGIYKE